MFLLHGAFAFADSTFDDSRTFTIFAGISGAKDRYYPPLPLAGRTFD
ncbi:unnamed protein product [marine sediment metagenome]|uniref:Uncharacterized protein n=1 Tax=marine sediment metagenome TaxID=412755 RepID=X1I6M6_9ZZZZ